MPRVHSSADDYGIRRATALGVKRTKCYWNGELVRRLPKLRRNSESIMKPTDSVIGKPTPNRFNCGAACVRMPKALLVDGS